MKTIAKVFVSILSVSALSVALTKQHYFSEQNTVDESLYACFWVTYCGDPDNYSPLPEPKDSKTDINAPKDDKLS